MNPLLMAVSLVLVVLGIVLAAWLDSRRTIGSLWGYLAFVVLGIVSAGFVGFNILEMIR